MLFKLIYLANFELQKEKMLYKQHSIPLDSSKPPPLIRQIHS